MNNSRTEEILETLRKEKALVERRVGKLFVLAGLMNLTPVELMIAAYHLMALGTYKTGAPLSKSDDLMGAVAEALSTMNEAGEELDPASWAQKRSIAAVTNHALPGVMLTEVDPIPTVAFKPTKSGWDDPVRTV